MPLTTRRIWAGSLADSRRVCMHIVSLGIQTQTPLHMVGPLTLWTIHPPFGGWDRPSCKKDLIIFKVTVMCEPDNSLNPPWANAPLCVCTHVCRAFGSGSARVSNVSCVNQTFNPLRTCQLPSRCELFDPRRGSTFDFSRGSADIRKKKEKISRVFNSQFVTSGSTRGPSASLRPFPSLWCLRRFS